MLLISLAVKGLFLFYLDCSAVEGMYSFGLVIRIISSRNSLRMNSEVNLVPEMYFGEYRTEAFRDLALIYFSSGRPCVNFPPEDSNPR